MPQLDFSTYFTQTLYLQIIIAYLFVVFSIRLLPKLLSFWLAYSARDSRELSITHSNNINTLETSDYNRNTFSIFKIKIHKNIWKNGRN